MPRFAENQFLNAVQAVTGATTEKNVGPAQNAGEAMVQRIQNDPVNQAKAERYAEVAGDTGGGDSGSGLVLGQWEPDSSRPGMLRRQLVSRDSRQLTQGSGVQNSLLSGLTGTRDGDRNLADSQAKAGAAVGSGNLQTGLTGSQETERSSLEKYQALQQKVNELTGQDKTYWSDADWITFELAKADAQRARTGQSISSSSEALIRDTKPAGTQAGLGTGKAGEGKRGPGKKSSTSRTSQTRAESEEPRTQEQVRQSISNMEATGSRITAAARTAAGGTGDYTRLVESFMSQRAQWNRDRKTLMDELEQLDTEAGWVIDPNRATELETRRTEIIRTLEDGDAAAGYGPRSYGDTDRARRVFSAASKDYASGFLNDLGTALDTLYEGANTNPYAGWATDEMSALQIRPERDEEEMKAYEFLKSGAHTLESMADSLGESAASDLEHAKGELGTLGQAGVDIATNLIQMGYDAAIGAVLGNALGAAGIATSHAGLIPMFMRSSGSAAREARLEGASASEQFWFGKVKGGIEVGTELLSNGVSSALSKFYGKGIADDIAEEVIRKLVKTDIGRTFARFVMGSAGEGVEEAISDLLSPIAEIIYKGIPEGGLYKDFNVSGMIYDFLIGTAIGSIGSVVGIATGENRAANAELRARDLEEAMKGGLQVGEAESLAETAQEVVKKPYEEMTEEERKEAWDRLYESAEQSETENGDADSEIKYAYDGDPAEVTREEVQTLVENCGYGMYDDSTYIPVRVNTPQILIDEIERDTDGAVQVPDHPMIMQVEHVRQVTEEAEERDMKGGKRPHQIGSDEFVELMERMDDPNQIVLQQNGRYAEVIHYRTKDGNRVVAVVDAGEGRSPSNINPEYMNGYDGGEYNVLVTLYAPDEIQQYYKNKVERIAYEKNGAAHRGYGSEIPSHMSRSPFYTGDSQRGSGRPAPSRLNESPEENSITEGRENGKQESNEQRGVDDNGGQTYQQGTAQTQQGLSEPAQAQQAEGEVGLRVGEADNVTAAGGTEPAVGTIGEDAADRGRGRLDDGRTGGEAERLGTDGRPGSGEPGAVGERRNAAGESLGDAVRRSGVEELSSRGFGLTTGTDSKTFCVVPEEMLTPELRDLRNGIRNTTGYNVDFIAGYMEVTGMDGRVRRVGGYCDRAGRRIVIRVDSRRYTAWQIGRHEQFHALAEKDPELVRIIRERILNRYGRDELERIVNVYICKRRGLNQTENIRGALDEAANEILEEIFADANGAMNAFDAGANRFAYDTWRGIHERNQELRNQTTDGSRVTRGPPMSAPSWEEKRYGERYSYAGEEAETADLEALDRAKDMELQDVDKETIRRETGWFRGMDGKWRFEIDDSEAKYSRAGDVEFRRDHPEYAEFRDLLTRFGELSEEEMARVQELHATWNDEIGRLARRLENGSVPLNQVLDHPALFRAYPELKEVRVQIREIGSDVQGGYSAVTNTIIINKDARDKLSTLLHETQHAIQEIEGFTGGASTEYWMDRNAREQPELDRRMGDLRASARSIRDELDRQRALAGYDEFVDQAYGQAEAGAITEAEAEKRIQKFEEDHVGIRSLENALDEVFGEMQEIRRAMRTAEDLYRNTAGEIEARDVEARQHLNREGRAAKAPDLGDEDTVFADQVETLLNANEDPEILHLKEQIKAAKDVLAEMKPVANITAPTRYPQRQSDKVAWAERELKKYGNVIDIPDFGKVNLGNRIERGMKYARTDADRAAFLAIPAVLKRGRIIGHHAQHKGGKVNTSQDVESWTFGAPVTINGKTGNMGVIVQKTTGLFYKAHKVLMPDGSAFILDEMNDAEPGRVQGAVLNDRLVTPTGSATVDTLPQQNQNGKEKFSASVVDEETMKNRQLEIILSSNPAQDDNHTWIRSVEDIKTFSEAIHDSEYEGENITPDYTWEMAEQAEKSGKITVYSSNRIRTGTFVTPSRMEAENYGSDIRSMTVPVQHVAWIDALEGQYTGELKERFSVSEEDEDSNQMTLDDVSGGEMYKSGMNPETRSQLEAAEQLTGRLQEYFLNVDPESEAWLSEDEIAALTELNLYENDRTRGDMGGADEIMESLSELSEDQAGSARRETWELMEQLMPHMDPFTQSLWTGDEPRDQHFARWYNRRHPSLYYPGYKPGDLFDSSKEETDWEGTFQEGNIEREREYLRGLLDSGRLMEPELTEARDFLRQLENPEEGRVFYSTEEDEELTAIREERDRLEAKMARLVSLGDGNYRDSETGETVTMKEASEIAERYMELDDRYQAMAGEGDTSSALRAPSPQGEGVEETGGELQVGETENGRQEETRTDAQQTGLQEDPKDRTIRELRAMNRQLEKYAEYWKKQGRITGEGEEKAKRRDVQRITRELMEHAGYQGERSTLQEKIQALADTVVSGNQGNGLNWEDLRAQASEIAEELVDGSYTIMDPEEDLRQNLKTRLKELKIRPDKRWTDDIGDWNSFRKQQIGTLVFSRDGQDIDSVYQILNGEFGEGLFPSDITAGSDQVNRILTALDSLQEQREYSFANEQDAELAEQYYTNRILDEVLYGEVGPELTKADRNYQRVKARMVKAEREVREIRKESRARIEDLQRNQRLEVKGALMKQRETMAEREKIRKVRKKIDQTGKRLVKYMAENNGKNPVPEPLKEAVGRALLDLDLSGGMEKGQKKRYVRNMQEIARIVARQNSYMQGETDRWAGMYLDLPADTVEALNEHLDNVQKAMEEAEARGRTWNPNMLSLEELERLDEILTVLSSAITNANEILSDARGAKVSDEAGAGIEYMKSLGTDRERSTTGEKINRFLRFQNTTPYYFFRKLGEPGLRMFERIQDGWDKFAFNAKQVVDFANRTYTAKEAKEIQEQIFTFQLRRRGDMTEGFDKPETVTMTKAQIMSLYCLWKREQAQGHLAGAGIRIADYQDGKRTVKQAENYLLDLEDIDKILSVLTPRDREIADALQHYMNTVGSDWGNEVSMKRFGIRSFTEENYFPIQTDDRSRQLRNPESDTANLYRLLNMSFTKSVTREASNSIVLDNIFDVFANHMADMAKYNGLGLPMLDAMKWFSYQQTGELNEEGQYGYDSIQKQAEIAFGREARNYFTTFMQDLNGVREGGRGEEFGSRMLSGYKVAAVGANLRVALLQPTSYLRASAVLDKKYLVKGLQRSNKLGQQEAMEWSGTAVWKDLGFYDTNINAGLREMIKHADGTKEKIQELSMKGAELGDKMTWGALWNACRAEQEDKGLTGDELMEATARRFREVVYRTQVMDSTMTRSHVMRQKGAYAGMVTAFMSEPTLSYNMLMDAYSQYESEVRKNMAGKSDKDQKAKKEARDKAWKKTRGSVGKAAGAYLATAILSAIVESAIDAARDDEEYATYLERFSTALLGINPADKDAGVWERIKAIPNGNLMEDLLVHNKLPVIKDFFGMLGGQDAGRMDTEWMASIIKAGQIWAETIALQMGWKDKPTKATYNGNMTLWGKLYNTLRAASQIAGLPMGNAIRDAVAIWNTTAGEANPRLKIQTYDPGEEKKIQYAVKDGFLTEEEAVQLLLKYELADDEIDAQQMAYAWAHPERYERLLAAMNAGDQEEFTAAQEELGDLRFRPSSIATAISGEIEERYLGHDGDGNPVESPIDRETAVQMLMQYGGMIERKAEELVQRWSCELETGIPYDKISEAYVAGDISKIQAEGMLVQYGGYAEEKAAAQVQKWSSTIDTGIGYSEIGDRFFYGEITQEEAVEMYMKYGGKSQEDAEDAVLKIAFRRDTGHERERVELQTMYVEGEYSRDEMKRMMLEYKYSKTPESAENSLIRWDFIGKDMTLDEVSPWQAKRYFDELEAADIDKHLYLEFVQQAETLKGDTDENGKSIPYSKMDKVFALIDSLDLTPEQKDALALAGWDSSNDGYSEKNLSRAPWHDGESSTSKSKKKSSGRRSYGGRRGGGRRRGGGGGGLTLGAAFAEPDNGHSGMFNQILRMWKRKKYSRAQILALVRAGKLTKEEADEILATAQEADSITGTSNTAAGTDAAAGAEGEPTVDGSLTLGAAEEEKKSA